MRKSIVLPILAVLGGGVGFLLRRWELTSAFEGETGLPIPNAPAFWALVAFSLLMATLLFLLCRGKHRVFQAGYDDAFAAKGNTLYITAMVLAAFLLLAGGVLSFLALPQDYQTALSATSLSRNSGTTAVMVSLLPKALLAVLAVASFFSLLSLGRNSYRGEGKGKYSGALLAPGFLCAIWLISAYQTHAGNPIRQSYLCELLAIIAALLAIYFIAGFSFEKGKVFRAAVFSLLAVYLCAVTLADPHHSLAHVLFYGALILYLTAQVTALLFNDGRMPGIRTVTDTKIETETEETDHEG